MINNLMGMTFMDMLPAMFMISTVLNVLCCYYAWCRIATLTKRVETLENENAEFKKENATLKKDNATLKKDNATLKKDNATLKKDNATLKKDNATLKKDNATLMKRVETLENEVETLKNENATLKTRVETLENENATLKTRVETLENDNATLKKDNEQLFILFDKTIGIVEAVEDDLDVRELLNTMNNIIKVNQKLDGNNSRLRPTLLNLFISPEFDLLKEPANNFAHRDRLMTPSAQTKASTRVTNGSFGDVLDGSPYSLEQFNFLSNLAHGASPDTRKQLLDCNTSKQRLKKNTKATAVNNLFNERLAAAAAAEDTEN